MATRKTTHYSYNSRYDVDHFDINTINKNNIVNQFLVMTPEDISSNVIMELFGQFNGKVLVHHYDTFDVPEGAFKFTNDKGKEVSNSNKFRTTFGIWIFNLFLLKGLGMSAITGGYVNENMDKKKFGKLHQKILYALMEDRIDTEQYKQFIEYVDFIMPWETILAPAQSLKLLACTKEIDKLKSQLIKENQAAVDAGDTAVVEDIEKKLIKFAKDYLKDDPALDGYLSGAGGTLENNFKNMYIMKGIIRNPDPNAKQEYNTATSSFIDGISADEYSLLANSLAGGPYSRAKKTELGGYWEKLIVAALSSVTIDEPNSDCGTDKYIETVLTDDLIDAFIYSYIIKPDGSLEELTSDNIDKYRNKKVKVRSTLFCKNNNGKVCHHCAGNFFYRRGNKNIGLAASQIATRLKLTSMKAFHNSTVTTAEIEPLKAFRLN